MAGGESVQWLPAIVVMLSGIAAALVVMAVVRGRQSRLAREHEIDTSEELREQFDQKIAALRAIGETADVGDRELLEREAATLLRKIESREPNAAAAQGEVRSDEPSVARRGRRDARHPASGFMWGAGTATAIALIMFFVMTSATEREEGGSLTGGIDAPSGPQSQQGSVLASPEIQNLEAWIAANPDDLDARLELARVYIMQQELMKVWAQTEYVLERVPGHPRASAYQAVVRLAMGQTDVALTMLEDSIEADPTLLDARIHLALAYLQLSRPQEAVRILEEAKKIHPNQAAQIDQLLREVLQQWPNVQSE